MFNSPINPMFGVNSAGQEGQREQSSNKNSQDKEQNKKDKNIFSEENELELYTDIIEESFDAQEYILKYFERLKEKYFNVEDKLEKIEHFIKRFNYIKFCNKYGKNLSKEDLNVILYEKVIELGL